MNSDERLQQIGESIRSAARERWLNIEEIYQILVEDTNRMGFTLSTFSIADPQDGELALFDNRSLISDKKLSHANIDEIDWAKKKGSDIKIQEVNQNLKIYGFDIIKGTYAKSTHNHQFKRRIYRMIDKSYHYVLVHYRNTTNDVVKRAVSNNLCQLNPVVFDTLPSQLDRYNAKPSDRLSITSLENKSLIHDNVGRIQQDSQFSTLFNSHHTLEPNFDFDFINEANDVEAFETETNSAINEIDLELYNELFNLSPMKVHNENLQSNLVHEDTMISSHMHHDENNRTLLSVIDYSPELDSNPTGNSKLLICIQHETSVTSQFDLTSIQVHFGDMGSVHAKFIQSNVIRCRTPNWTALLKDTCMDISVPIWISDHQGIRVTDNSAVLFRIHLPSISYSNDSSMFNVQTNQRQFTPTNRLVSSTTEAATSSPTQSPHSFLQTVEIKGSEKLNDFSTSPLRRRRPYPTALLSPGRTFGNHPPNTDAPEQQGADNAINKNQSAHQSDRENKIRIVEILGYVKSALHHEDHDRSVMPAPISRIPLNPLQFPADQLSDGTKTDTGSLALSTADHTRVFHKSKATKRSHSEETNGIENYVRNEQQTGEEWLDDTQLETLSNEELEILMDKYISSVVKQLVQLAAVDDDLETEIDSLDDNGFSLLHYCSWYNLTALIPVLLARGSHINALTGSGFTPLHLAAENGHLAVVQLLVENGIDISVIDKDDLTACKRAKAFGHLDVAEYLSEIELSNADKQMIVDENQSHERTSAHINRLVTLPQPTNQNELIVESDSQTNENVIEMTTQSLDITSQIDVRVSPIHTNTNSSRRNSNGSPTSNAPTPKHAQISPPQLSKHSPVLSSTNLAGLLLPSNSGSSLSSILLHDAFTSLSLTDKCALSVSLSQLQMQPNPQQTPEMDSSSKVTMISSSPTAGFNSKNVSQTTSSTTNITPRNKSFSTDRRPSRDQNKIMANLFNSTSDNHSKSSVDNNEYELEWDMQSVISGTDKESLDLAMAMMDHKELMQVETEVRKIQNNVRGWLLRKNYVNLRGAAKVLQIAWRERKKMATIQSSHSLQDMDVRHCREETIHSSSHKPLRSEINQSLTGTNFGLHMNPSIVSNASSSHQVLSSNSASLMAGFSKPIFRANIVNSPQNEASRDINVFADNSRFRFHNPMEMDRELHAAATLQAATRRMLARRNFLLVRKQTMASLTIQKHLVRWWANNRLNT